MELEDYLIKEKKEKKFIKRFMEKNPIKIKNNNSYSFISINC